MVLVRTEIPVAADPCFRVELTQQHEKPQECVLLALCARIFWLAIHIKPADINDAYAVGIVAADVCPYNVNVSPWLYPAIETYHIMVAYVCPALLNVHPTDVTDIEVLIRACRRAVHYNVRYRPYALLLAEYHTHCLWQQLGKCSRTYDAV